MIDQGLHGQDMVWVCFRGACNVKGVCTRATTRCRFRLDVPSFSAAPNMLPLKHITCNTFKIRFFFQLLLDYDACPSAPVRGMALLCLWDE